MSVSTPSMSFAICWSILYTLFIYISSQTCALYPGGTKEAKYTLYSDPRFYPMAGINALGHITFRF